MSDERTCVKPDAKLQRYAWQMSHFKVATLMKQIEGHCGNLFGVVGSGVWKAANHHVRVANRFDLVNVIVAHDCGVKASV